MTLHELAHELNLSIATISRALSRPEDVAPPTRQRVLAAVHRHGYTPNGTRRSLRTQQTRTIGIVISDIRNLFFSAVVKVFSAKLLDKVHQEKGRPSPSPEEIGCRCTLRLCPAGRF
jgi:DNA-binding LacI/PurR family transcriptional regulator